MGDIADMMLDGTLCEQCGDYIGESIGYPRVCSDCSDHNISMKNSVKNQRKQKLIEENQFRVKYRSNFKEPIKLFPQKFSARRQARKFCWNRRFLYDTLIIFHPDGHEETLFVDYGKKP